MYSIFGTGSIVLSGSFGGINIPYTMVTDNSYTDVIEHISIFNDSINYIPLGDYAYYDILINLGKYPNSGSAYYSLANIEHTVISKFYLHEDGDYFRTTTGNSASFYVETVEPAYLENTIYYDICRIKLKSTSYVSYTTASAGYGFNYASDYGPSY